MSKIILDDDSTNLDPLVINENFRKIEEEFNEKVLYRKNPEGEPNEMENHLDMNEHRIYNLPKPIEGHEPLRLTDIGFLPEEIKEYAEESKEWAEKSKDYYEHTLEALAEGEVYIGDYGPGLTINSYTEFFGKDGIWYRPSPVLELPYTTTGDWETEGSLFVAVGDAALRQELSESGGSNMVGFRQPNEFAIYRSVQEKLQEWVNVKDFGAKGDGVTDDTTNIQRAINYLDSLGGGTLFFPPGTYLGRNIGIKDRITLKGNFGSVIIKVPDGFDSQVLHNPDWGTGIVRNFIGLEGIIFDGNWENSPRINAQSAVAINLFNYFKIKDCIFRNAAGYGLGFQGVPPTYSGTQSNVILENCHFINNGHGRESGGDTYDGMDVKNCKNITLIGCTAINNVDKGINLRGDIITIVGGFAENNGSAGYEFAGNSGSAEGGANPISCTAKILGCEARSNGGAGFAIADGHPQPVNQVRVSLSSILSANNLFGIQVPGGGSQVELIVDSAFIFGSVEDGIILSSERMRSCIISKCTIRSNSGSGIRSRASKAQISDCQINLNGKYGIEIIGNNKRTLVSGSTYIEANGLGNFLLPSDGRNVIGSDVYDYNIGSDDIIQSVSNLTIPNTGKFFRIAGTTDINNIFPVGNIGRSIVLMFQNVLTVRKGGNLALSENFVTSSVDTLELVSDGNNWIEVSRSVN